MTKEKFRTEVRRRFENLTPQDQEVAALRGLGKPVFAWDLLTSAQLNRLLGATVVVSLLTE